MQVTSPLTASSSVSKSIVSNNQEDAKPQCIELLSPELSPEREGDDGDEKEPTQRVAASQMGTKTYQAQPDRT